MEIAPQSTPVSTEGTLQFRFAGVLLEFPDCRVDQASIRFDERGLVTSLSIWDRRWKWNAGGSLSGNYNRRQANAATGAGLQQPPTLVPRDGSIRTPRQLAALCLLAMGEATFDVSQLPNDTYPLVEWENVNPAQALAAMAEQLGCRVVLRLDNTVQVARTGVGLDLPHDLPILSESITINPPRRPDALEVVTGANLYQADIGLEAVGMDIDGAIKPINDLSYKPRSGWGNEKPGDFFNVENRRRPGVPIPPRDMQVTNPRDLALDTVFRWYRARNFAQADGSFGLNLPGYGRIRWLEQILPLGDVQAETWVDPLDEFRRTRPKPPWLFGQYMRLYLDYANSEPNTFYYGNFSIDREHGIVKLSDYATRLAADGRTNLSAILKLRVAVTIRNEQTWALERQTQRLNYPEPRGTGARQLKHDEIVFFSIAEYDLENNRVTRIKTNRDDVVREANYYLAAADLEYQVRLPQEIAYAGLIPLSPDGAIQAVTWTVGSSGATTRASRNDEINIPIIPYRERRMLEKLRHDALANLQKQVGEKVKDPFPKEWRR